MEEEPHTDEIEDFSFLLQSVYLKHLSSTNYSIFQRNQSLLASEKLKHRKPNPDFLWPVPIPELCENIGCSPLQHDTKYLMSMSALGSGKSDSPFCRVSGNPIMEEVAVSLLRKSYEKQVYDDESDNEDDEESDDESDDDDEEDDNDDNDDNLNDITSENASHDIHEIESPDVDEMLENDFIGLAPILLRKLEGLLEAIAARKEFIPIEETEEGGIPKGLKKMERERRKKAELPLKWEDVMQLAVDISKQSSNPRNAFSLKSIERAHEKAKLILFPSSPPPTVNE